MRPTISLPPRERDAPWDAESLSRLVDRIEKAMRPLSGGRYGPDHDRVRELYRYLRTISTGDALARARRVVLYEILTSTVDPTTERHGSHPRLVST